MGEIANRALLNILTTSDETILKKPLVIDADALNLISGSKEKIDLLKEQGRRGRTLILTPHLMELLRLWNGCFENEKLDLTELKEQVSTCAYMLSKELGAIVVAKDARTFISMNGRPLCMNLSGNSGMATAGSGDVLAGMITAFLAQSKEDPFLLTCKAVRYHGLMGELATKKIGEHALTAGDLIAQ